MNHESYKTSLKNCSSYLASRESYLVKEMSFSFLASDERRATSNGFSLLELIGVIAIVAILGAVISPTVINHLKAAERDAEVETLEGVAHAIEIYLRENHAWPPDLVTTLTPDYIPLDTRQLTVNDGGFSSLFLRASRYQRHHECHRLVSE